MLTVPLFWGVYFPCYAGAKRLLLPHCEHKPLVHRRRFSRSAA